MNTSYSILREEWIRVRNVTYVTISYYSNLVSLRLLCKLELSYDIWAYDIYSMPKQLKLLFCLKPSLAVFMGTFPSVYQGFNFSISTISS